VKGRTQGSPLHQHPASSIQHPELGVVVNGPTSSLMEQLAHYLGFTIKRVEVGEANVATGGMALHDQGFHVPIMGEGSNGSVFNLDLLVREPLHTVRTLTNFITRPELTKMLLNCLHQVDQNKLAACSTEDKYDDWHSPERVNSLLMNIINSLPPSATTDFFTDEGIRRSDHDLPQELLKANFDAYFESQLWPKIAEEIREDFQGEPMAEFVNYEGENELRGKGNRETSAGGYKVELYVKMQDGDKRHIGWIWFRPSGTERGVMRRGVSISHWDASNPRAAEIVDRVYKYMDATLANALNIVEEKTLTMCSDQPQKR
jgi:phosphoglucomutase